jgi:hypothetical protein
MSSDSTRVIHKFLRVEVTDLQGFVAVHKKARAAHEALRLSEAVYQSTEKPNELTLILAGTEGEIQDWLNGADRIRLVARWSSSAINRRGI